MEGSFLKKALVFLFIFALNLGLIYLIKKPEVASLSNKDFVDALVLAAFNTVNIMFVVPFLAKKFPQ